MSSEAGPRGVALRSVFTGSRHKRGGAPMHRREQLSRVGNHRDTFTPSWPSHTALGTSHPYVGDKRCKYISY